MVVFACKRKLIKSRLSDGLKMLTFRLALNRPEKLPRIGSNNDVISRKTRKQRLGPPETDIW